MKRSIEATHIGVTASALLELMKPVTWFPPMWAFMCGVVSAGTSVEGRWSFVALGAILTGPLVCATSQIVNDWFDRGVDAINEPYRPIPSGRVPGDWGLYFAVLWSAVSLAVASTLGNIVFVATIIGLVLAWAYSAPPVRLKTNGWWGNSAVALCYEGLPWITGASVMAGALPNWPGLVVPLLYSFGAHGIMTLNDFKSIEGDKRFGIASLPVQHGAERAGLIACVMMAIPQIVVIGLLFDWNRPIHAALIAVSLAVQLYLMTRLVKSPRELAPWYNATGVSLYVSGMLIAAFALRSINGAML
ncbi:chlorophyll synthase ChlG [Hyphomicrobium sp.]|uniref:chlorophyll synthase ChlG n=1 Tax=Hyphomicrobium sp. TaxID=82 RepID=UPI000FAD5E8C|nr:chlorophyll synthase ChlG [Hyphomicrobium sp.]RUP00558.1 MAG: chlorophyll synthase ChlG [Hyphomicrobium sp.]